MKRLSLVKGVSGESKEKVAFDDFIIVENYLVLREMSNLLIYKYSKLSKSTFEFLKEIKLKNQNSIKSIDAINPKNVFVIYYTNEIYVVDIERSVQEDVKLNIIDKTSLTVANEISIHDQCELKALNKTVYIGFVSVNNKDLYLAYKDWDSKSYILNCLSVRNFKDEIIHIEYKFYNYNDKTYLFLCILCKMEGYAINIVIKEKFDIIKFNNTIKTTWIWNSLFSENNIISYHYSFYYSLTSPEQNSFLIFTDQNKCMIWNFNKDLNKPNTFLTKYEHKYKSEKRYNNSIVGVNHYDKRLFVTTKEDLIEYKLLSNLTTASNTYKHTVRDIIKIKVYDMPNFVSLLFLSSKEVWTYVLESNENQSKRVSSNISLSGIDNSSQEAKDSKDSKGEIKKPKKIMKDNIEKKKSRRHSSFMKEKGGKKEKTITIRESLNQIQHFDSKDEKADAKMEENKDKGDGQNAEPTNFKCDVCDLMAKYRCSLCHKFFVCDKMEHKPDWEKHKKNCPNLPKAKKIEHYTDLIKYQPLWNEQRRVIVEHLRKKEFSEAIEKNYILIQDNYNLLKQYEKDLKILPLQDLLVIENNKKDLLDTFLYYEDYFCNFLLLR